MNTSQILQEAEQLNINGLLFQHIVLCPTRTWLHYHRIDCAHLNRHMQAGLLLHETAYGGEAAEPFFGFGIAPDMLNFKKLEISEVKKSKSREDATISQLTFYIAVMQQATQQPWYGIVRYPNSRRTKRIEMTEDRRINLQQVFTQIKTVIAQSQPPAKTDKPLCKHCSYRMLCWGESTEDADY
jgi:CRISPR-associated exonuclease Cas4